MNIINGFISCPIALGLLVARKGEDVLKFQLLRGLFILKGKELKESF
ncbi:MAG: hypothetical protein PHO37_10535 [Kiritimatiellae bacterium]|nr:hypothetical protein [Kiritimatiellia bacterium]